MSWQMTVSLSWDRKCWLLDLCLSSGCCNENTPHRGACGQQMCNSHSSEAGGPRSRCWQVPCLVRACRLVRRRPSSCHVVGREGVCGVSFVRAPVPLTRAAPGCLLLPSPWGKGRISTYEFWKSTSIQSIAILLSNLWF